LQLNLTSVIRFENEDCPLPVIGLHQLEAAFFHLNRAAFYNNRS
jgi:hypothetical protein